MKFLRYLPGLSWQDVDEMPHSLWRRCRDEIDVIEGRV